MAVILTLSMRFCMGSKSVVDVAEPAESDAYVTSLDDGPVDVPVMGWYPE